MQGALRPYWSKILAQAWDETPLLRSRHTVGSLAVAILAQGLAWVTNATTAAVIENTIVFVLGAWLAVSGLWMFANLVRAPSEVHTAVQHELAERDGRLQALADRAPKIVGIKPSAFVHNQLAVGVQLRNPGDATTLNDDWSLSISTTSGSIFRSVTAFVHGGFRELPQGGRAGIDVVFGFGDGKGYEYDATTDTWSLPVEGKDQALERQDLRGARYVLTVSDVRDYRLQAEYPVD